MNFSQGLLIKNIILRGHRKNYQIPFYPGVNVIYGDVDTGKSTILRLIHYLLGGKAIKLDKEIAASVNSAVLELAINGSDYCISRDIFNASRDIDVYSCKFSEISHAYPEKYKSTVSKGNDQDKSLSEFLLSSLEYPTVRLKQSPTRDSSGTARLSFLDLFKYMYLSQDDVGSKKMLNIGNPIRETKNKEVFKSVFSVLDSNISELETEIARKSQEAHLLISQYETVTNFLSQTEFKSREILDDDISKIDDFKIEIQNRLSDLNGRMTSDSELYEGLKDALNTNSLNIKMQTEAKNTALDSIDRFTRLNNDYLNDIGKIKASLSSQDIIGHENVNEKTSCPVCETIIEVGDLAEKYEIPSGTRLKGELTSITRRSKDLVQLLADNRANLETANALLTELNIERMKVRNMIDEEFKDSITPYIAERDAIVRELAQLDGSREELIHSLRVRNTQETITKKIGNLESAISTLKLRLTNQQDEAPSMDEILGDLSIDLNKFIMTVKIKNHHGVRIDSKSLLPVVRDIEYRYINSGGLRTIVSIGYLASILLQKLRKETNIPGLLMIDTVGKYLGKTPEQTEEPLQDDIDGVADPDKYRNLFEALIGIADQFEESNKLCQIILVDNDIPLDVAHEYQDFVIGHYRSNGLNGLPIGLIDDWDKIPKDTNTLNL